jgi:predicted nucleic acid-binding protein
VIAYFDTSAVIPLLVDETGTELCSRLWNESTRVVSVRLVHPEARAALAQARRLGRITRSQLAEAVAELDSLVDQIDIIELGADIARSAGDLAEQHGLGGYDSVHLAAALAVADDELVLLTGDTELATAAVSAGIAVAASTP